MKDAPLATAIGREVKGYSKTSARRRVAPASQAIAHGAAAGRARRRLCAAGWSASGIQVALVQVGLLRVQRVSHGTGQGMRLPVAVQRRGAFRFGWRQRLGFSDQGRLFFLRRKPTRAGEEPALVGRALGIARRRCCRVERGCKRASRHGSQRQQAEHAEGIQQPRPATAIAGGKLQCSGDQWRQGGGPFQPSDEC